ncbi:PREDICTED: breast cancer type 2 susceptibility protein [Gekko japonicus]|uniref:Breast cancer type 2 susceptibility protein n=1 Tax=Gekko japonicus TaxID=146911 RepID=A0ABM1L145_GEKJA|nr:PREDICTED: breast cancer type 2 susceptibility protein [Gekko japonicus]
MELEDDFVSVASVQIGHNSILQHGNEKGCCILDTAGGSQKCGLLNNTSDAMDKNVPISKGRSSFFEMFKTRCSESDLGPISLNWLEELSSEVPPYDCKISEDAEYKASLDEHAFKMPKKKLFTNSQLASTPLILKEQSQILPLFVSPVKEMDQSTMEAGRSVNEAPATRTKLDQSNEVISPPSNNRLISSPAVLRNICGTPLGYKSVLNGSLLSTPKIFQAQTPKCISESLGAEADPEMSWSSSLATPPTLSPTVVIATGDKAASGKKEHNERLALIMQSLLSKYGRSPGKNILSTAGIEDLCSEDDSKNQNFGKLLDGCFGIDKLPNKSSVNQKPPNNLEDEEMHEETDTTGGIEGSFSVCFTSGNTFQREMKTDIWSKNYSDKAKHNDLKENNAAKGDSKDVNIEKYETELNSSMYNLHRMIIPGNRTQNHCADQINICVEEEMPSSVFSAWSQLDLSGLEITQLEKVSSCYSGSPSNIYIKKNSEDHIPSTSKECARTSSLESCILNTSSLINVHKLLNANSPEKTAGSKNSPVPVETINSPTLVKGCETKQASVINDSENLSFLTENTTFTEFLEAHSSCHHKYSKDNSKTSPGSPGDSILTAAAGDGRGLKKSGLATTSSLSSFKRRPQKFVYSLKDTSVYQEEGTTQTGGSYLVPSGAELKSSNTEVSGAATGNKGQTEESSSGNECVEERQKVEFEKSWTWTNTTPFNKKPTVGTDQLPLLNIDRKNDTNLPSHLIAANQGTESSENKIHTSSSKDTSGKENSDKCARLTNCNSFQEGSSEASELAMQALKRGNRQVPLGLVAQHSLESCTQMAELGHLSKKTSKPNVDEPSNPVVLEKSLDLRQPLLDNDKQMKLGHASHNKNQGFASFKTVSNKQIAFSEDNIRKGKLLFKDIEEEFLKSFPCEQMQYIPNQNVQENAEIPAVRMNKLNKSIPNFCHVSDSQVSLIEFSDSKNMFPEFFLNASVQNVLKNQQGKQILTASEEAEVAELSSILEETGSQFEFTQLRKQRAVLQNSTCKVSGSTNKHEAWKDNFKEGCKSKSQRDNDQSPHKYRDRDTTEESAIQKHTNEELTSVNLSSRKQNRECSVPNALASLHCGLSDLAECRSAGRKESAISSEIFNKPSDLVSDLDGVGKMHSLHRTKLKNNCSNRCDPCWNNPRYMKETGIDWHHMVKTVNAEYMMKNNARDTANFVKENMEKKSNRTGYNEDNIIHISSTTEVNLKIVQKYSIRMTGNDLSTMENNHSILVSRQFINCEETHCNDLQETLSDLTCLVEVAKTEQNSILNNVDEKENLNSNQNSDQQEKKVHSPEGGYLVPTMANQNILVPQARKNKAFHVLADCCVGKELDDMSSTSCGKTDVGNKKGPITSVKKSIDLNQGESLKHNSAMGFCTASGKQIAISDKSLAKARYILSEDSTFSEKDGLSNFVSPGIQHSIKENENENIAKVRKEFEDRIEKYNEVLNLTIGSDDPLDLLPDNVTIKQTETLETVTKPSLEINTSERRKKYDITEGLVTENNPAQKPNKSDASKSLSMYSDNDQCLHVEEGSGIYAKQDSQQPLSRNPSDVFINNNKNWDLTSSKTSSSILKSECSALHHSFNNNETNSNAENFIYMSQTTSPEMFNAEKFSTFEDIPKNVDFIAQKCDLNLLDMNNLQKDLSSEVSILASKLSTTRPVAFSTANGKAVRISQEALKKARQFLHTDCYESTKQTTEFQSEINKHGILESCSDALGTSEKIAAENSVAAQFPGAGKYSWEDKQALQYMGTMSLDAGPQSGCQTSCFQMIDKLSDPWASSKRNHIKSDFTRDTGNCEFFSTASGKPVQLTVESLKKARQLFSDIEENNSSVHPSHVSNDSHAEVFSVGNKMTPGKCKPLMSPGERLPNTEVNSQFCFGFSTASGKQVRVSEKALQKVTGFFKEIDDTGSNNYFENEQNLQQDHISPKEAPCVEAKADDEVISKSKLQEKCNALYLTTSNPNEKSKTLNASSESYTEKYKQPVQWEKPFPYTKQMAPLERHQPCRNRMKTTNATKLNTVTEGDLDSCYPLYSQTPKNDFETEASESAKAFMEDDELTDSEVQKNKGISVFVPEKTNNLLSNARTGKRRIEEENKFGEPPIKRKLLPEFDRSEGRDKSSLKASKTTPEDTMNDRRKFKYSIELKPAISIPFSSSKERQEVLHPNLTTPDQDLKGSKSKSNSYQEDMSMPSFSRPSASWTPFNKSLAKESKKTENDYIVQKPVKVFVPPFKTKPSISEDEIAHRKKDDLLGSKNIDRKEKLTPTKIQESTIEPEDNSFEDNSATQISLGYSEFTDTNSDLTKIVKDIQCARNLQEMRIIKKKRQRICPQPGNLYLVKTSAGARRIPLKDAVCKKLPGSYFSKQLYMFGVSKQCIKINSTNAEDFQFPIQDFFSKEYFLEEDGIQLADGGYLVPTDEGKAGKEEFYRALCDTPGVDPKLISKAWVYNHYRWIVWKLASMEVAFPQEFANKCLTPERVLFQLKYRYDVEVDKSHRSAIKRITERDDVAGKTLILCISKIISLSADVSQICDKGTAVENKREAAVIEITDGWYGIRAALDSALQSLLRRERLCVGQKIIVHGAELVGSQDACPPLEAPESLMLKISANSTRRARWYAKLGYHRDPRPFCLPLASLHSDGGTVGCVDILIQRVYPTQWMEKLSTGSYVFRNERAEEREAAKHKENQQKAMQALLAKIQAKFEMKEVTNEGKRSLRSRMLTRQQIRSLQDGAELYEAILNAPDPSYLEGYFSEEQLKALNRHRQMVNDKKQAQIEAEFRKAVESTNQEEHSCCRRDVTTVMKLRIVDYGKEERGKEVLLNIWRPSSHVHALLKEGCRYRIFQLVASQSKGKLETANVQLTATKKTQYLQLPVSQEILEHIYKPRECLSFSKILERSFQPSCSEVDLVGYLVSLRKGTGSSVLYLSDESHNLIAIQICTDFKQFAAEDIIVPSKLISASNLKWQPKCRSDIPTLFAGDLTAFSSNPKERHLQGKFNELKNIVENNSYFGKDAQQRLTNLLQLANPLAAAFNLPKECGLNPFPSSWKSSARNTHSIATPTNELRHQGPLTVGKQNSTPSVSLGSGKMIQELQETSKNLKKRKAMDLLSQVPSPPPVKPISTFVSPSLKKAFQPPRNCDTQHARSLEWTACKPVKKPSLNRLNEACFPLENNFVADEELAMINTQALLNNFPKERRVDFTDKITYAVLSDSPDGCLPRETSSQSAGRKDTLQESNKGTETPGRGASVTKSSLAVQQRQRRWK